MASNHEEYYQKLSLPPVPPPLSVAATSPKSPIRFVFSRKYQETDNEKQMRSIINEVDCEDLQKRLKSAMDRIVTCWSDKHDSLIDALDHLEKAKKKLEHRLNVQLQNHERSLREAQLYKLKYEQQVQQQRMIYNSNNRRRSILSSNASCISSKSFVSSSSTRSSSSCSSSIRHSNSFVDEIIDPILMFDNQLLVDSDNDEDIHANDNNEFDLYSALSDPDSCTLPVSPSITPMPSPLSLKSLSTDSNKHSTAAAPETPTDILTFACGDGFWNTIARGRSDKVGVDTLVG